MSDDVCRLCGGCGEVNCADKDGMLTEEVCPLCMRQEIAALTAERDALRTDREIAFIQHRNACADRVRWHAEFRKAEAECARLRGLEEKLAGAKLDAEFWHTQTVEMNERFVEAIEAAEKLKQLLKRHGVTE